ncbi:hypothetical protein [Streptomyces sp. NPDC047976]
MTSESPTALEPFGAHGFDGVTLDGLCDAVEHRFALPRSAGEPHAREGV